VVIDETSTVDATLHSIVAQTLPALDLVVAVPARVATKPMVRRLGQIARRFTRVTLVKPVASATHLRDVAFDASETPFVLSVRSGDLLASDACAELAAALGLGRAAFAWAPLDPSPATGFDPVRYDHVLLPGGVRRYAMTMVAKEAWAAGGGFADRRGEQTPDDFWAALLGLGLTGFGISASALATSGTIG
jgi:hypothetical protein